MRLTPEVLRMLQLRSCQLTLLTSLAFGAVLAVFSAPLTAQTTQDLPKTIPNLSGYDSEMRRTIEIACISEKINVAYGACLNGQIASLQKKMSKTPFAQAAPCLQLPKADAPTDLNPFCASF
jgi:hypothetical protein